jgi:hypothetical protein
VCLGQVKNQHKSWNEVVQEWLETQLNEVAFTFDFPSCLEVETLICIMR